VVGHVNSVLLGADGPDRHLLLIDPATGAATIVASNVGGGNGYNDLARNPITGVIYASQALNTAGLYTIDPETFTETFVGNMAGNVRAMAWSPDGATLYGFRNSVFGTINPTTAFFTPIGDSGIGFVGGIAFQPGSGVLFAATNQAPGLYTINRTTGAASFIGDPVEDLNSLEFLSDGTLLGGASRVSANPGYLIELDPLTAAPTLIGQTVPSGNQNLTALEVLPSTADFYSLTVTAGDSLHLETATPAAGPNEFVNLLDPSIELYDPTGLLVASDDNGAADGRNALLSHNAHLSGTYTVRVSGANQTQGEYVLAFALNEPLGTGSDIETVAESGTLIPSGIGGTATAAMSDVQLSANGTGPNVDTLIVDTTAVSDGRLTTAATVEIGALVPQEQIASPIAPMQQLLNEGPLNGRQASALIMQLQQIQTRFAAGNSNTARNMYQSFTNQAIDHAVTGVLTSEGGRTRLGATGSLRTTHSASFNGAVATDLALADARLLTGIRAFRL
jgi:hypothetical protein